MSRIYTCEHCGGVFPSDWTEAEAAAERTKLFGGQPEPDDVRLCDDCFRLIMAALNG